MSNRKAARNKPAATDAGDDLVNAVTAWADTFCKPDLPPNAKTINEWMAEFGRIRPLQCSRSAFQQRLMRLVRDGKWVKTGGTRTPYYWPASDPTSA